jgi:hypothetical protein
MAKRAFRDFMSDAGRFSADQERQQALVGKQ